MSGEGGELGRCLCCLGQVSELRDHEPQCSIWICQTKADLLEGSAGGGRRREVSSRAAQRFADSVGAPLASTSAKLGQGITVSACRRSKACLLML